jgi:hypothetical protein
VTTDSLSYSLAPLGFPFPALSARAGRLPLGGGREVALAALMTAHLAESTRGEYAVGQPERAARASQAKIWLASLALPAATRAPFTRCVDATAGTPNQVATALRSVVAATSAHLDGAAVRELELLLQHLVAGS